jgi:hypothetical protein
MTMIAINHLIIDSLRMTVIKTYIESFHSEDMLIAACRLTSIVLRCDRIFNFALRFDLISDRRVEKSRLNLNSSN